MFVAVSFYFLSIYHFVQKERYCNLLEGDFFVFETEQVISKRTCRVFVGWKMKALVFCQGSNSLACASDEGRIDVFR